MTERQRIEGSREKMQSEVTGNIESSREILGSGAVLFASTERLDTGKKLRDLLTMRNEDKEKESTAKDYVMCRTEVFY